MSANQNHVPATPEEVAAVKMWVVESYEDCGPDLVGSSIEAAVQGIKDLYSDVVVWEEVEDESWAVAESRFLRFEIRGHFPHDVGAHAGPGPYSIRPIEFAE